MLRCACLVVANSQTQNILLVRVRDNLKWYLPGGKIEPSETASEAVIRELKEELNIVIFPASLRLLVTIKDVAYGVADDVELNCFTAQYKGNLSPMAEISEVRMVNWRTEQDLLAPAVIKLCHYLDINPI